MNRNRPAVIVAGGIVPRPGAKIVERSAPAAVIVESEIHDGFEPRAGAPKFMESLEREPRIVCISGIRHEEDGKRFSTRVTCTACGWCHYSGSFSAAEAAIPKKCTVTPPEPDCPVEKNRKHMENLRKIRASRSKA